MANEQSEHHIGWDLVEPMTKMNLLMKLRKLLEGELTASRRVIDTPWSIIWMKKLSDEINQIFQGNSKRARKINRRTRLETTSSQLPL